MSNTLNFVTRNACPLCRNSQTTCLYDCDFGEGLTYEFILSFYRGRIPREAVAGRRYRIMHCAVCDFCYQQNILDEYSMEIFYDRLISDEESLTKREEAGHRYFHRLLESAKVIGTLVPSAQPRRVRVLDFGMGWGHWAIAAKALGYNVYGAELSEKRIAFAKMHGIPVIDVTAPEYAHTFDFINTDQVMEHVADPTAITSILARLLKPGGVLKIFVPDGARTAKEVMRSGWRPCKDAIQPLEHINAFTFKSLNRLVKSFGLQPVAVTDFKNPVWFAKAVRNRVLSPRRPSWFFRAGLSRT